MPAPLLVAGAQIGSQLISRAFSSRDQKKQRKFRREESEFEHGKNLEQWNRQNVLNKQLWDMQNTYNLPSAQMQRFKDAGLNPNLIYGQTNQADVIQKSEASKYQAPRTDFNPMIPNIGGGVLQAYQDMQMKSAQIDNVRMDSESKRVTSQVNHGVWQKLMFDIFGKDAKRYIKQQDFKSPYLQKTQAQVQSAQSEATLKKLEADTLQKMGIGGGSLGKLLQAISILFKR